MAKIKFGIFGPLSGQLGSLVGGTWKGIPYLKKAAVVKKSAVRTPAQINNEIKFKFVNNWLIPFHPFLNIGFERLAIGKTAVSAAFTPLYNTVFSGLANDIQIDYSKMKISSGSLRSLDHVSLSFTAADTLLIKWKKNYGKGARFDDQVNVAVFSPFAQRTAGFIGAVSRAAEEHIFMIQGKMIGKPIHAYLFVSSMNRKQISDTLYLGLIEPL